MMSFATSVKTCFRKYSVFSGRASRSEYWWFTLFSTIIIAILTLADVTYHGGGYSIEDDLGIFTLPAVILLAIPSLAVSIRRLHDINASGWWFLLNISIIGTAFLALLACIKGKDEPNRFGKPPSA